MIASLLIEAETIDGYMSMPLMLRKLFLCLCLISNSVFALEHDIGNFRCTDEEKTCYSVIDQWCCQSYESCGQYNASCSNARRIYFLYIPAGAPRTVVIVILSLFGVSVLCGCLKQCLSEHSGDSDDSCCSDGSCPSDSNSGSYSSTTVVYRNTEPPKPGVAAPASSIHNDENSLRAHVINQQPTEPFRGGAIQTSEIQASAPVLETEEFKPPPRAKAAAPISYRRANRRIFPIESLDIISQTEVDFPGQASSVTPNISIVSEIASKPVGDMDRYNLREKRRARRLREAETSSTPQTWVIYNDERASSDRFQNTQDNDEIDIQPPKRKSRKLPPIPTDYERFQTNSDSYTHQIRY